jgi:phosphotriesterase-related protein
MTVVGVIPAASLGRTLSHEHLFIDGSPFYAPPETAEEERASESVVSAETRDLIFRNACANLDNLTLEDPECAVSEARRFAELGGRTIVDVTVEGIGPRPEAVRDVARATGLNLVHGCGPYCEYALSPAQADGTVDEILVGILTSLNSGIDGTDVRAGVIGEIGVDGRRRGSERREHLVTPAEERGLRAAARASLATGTPVIVHQPNVPDASRRIMQILESEGLPTDRVCLGHMSSVLDLDLHIEAVERGYWVAYDTFGANMPNRFVEQANDRRRVAWLVELLKRGFDASVLVSHDTWCKLQLARYGGLGYTHIDEVILPALMRSGVSTRACRALLEGNPRRFFANRSTLTEGD